jgi:phosphate transport system ATP-binding protein
MITTSARMADRSEAASTLEKKVEVRGLSAYYGGFRALAEIQLHAYTNKITAIIGPSGCGKSTLLRSLNHMNDLTPNARVEGEILLDGENINAPNVDVVEVRRRIGMVFQRPNPFPKSIYDNVAYGPRLYGIRRASDLDGIVEQALRRAALWGCRFRAVNSSACALPAPWPSSRR